MKTKFKYLSMNLAHKKFRKLFSQELNFLLRRIGTWWLDQILTQLKRNEERRLSSYSNRAIGNGGRSSIEGCIGKCWSHAKNSKRPGWPFRGVMSPERLSTWHWSINKALAYISVCLLDTQASSEASIFRNPIIADGSHRFTLAAGFLLRKQTFRFGKIVFREMSFIAYSFKKSDCL